MESSSRRSRLHGEFFKEKIIAGLQKRREGMPATKVETNGFKAAIETADEVEHKRAVQNGLAKVAESISHALELPTVGGDVLTALLEVAEFRVEVEGTGFAIRTEL
jgi:hypothetical protein